VFQTMAVKVLSIGHRDARPAIRHMRVNVNLSDGPGSEEYEIPADKKRMHIDSARRRKAQPLLSVGAGLLPFARSSK